MTIRELREKIDEIRAVATLEKLDGKDISKYTAQIEKLETQILQLKEEQKQEKDREKLQKVREAMGLKGVR